MNKFKQLFCKHKYKFYSDTEVFPTAFSISSVKGYKYVCIKCGKEITLSSYDLLTEIKELRESIRKKIVLGEDVSDLDEHSEFLMNINDFPYPTKYSGMNIFALKKRYKEHGIDLDEITQWYRK